MFSFATESGHIFASFLSHLKLQSAPVAPVLLRQCVSDYSPFVEVSGSFVISPVDAEIP